MSETSYQFLRKVGREFGVEIHRPGISQLHFMVQSSNHLMRLCSRLREENCYLVTLVANDERELEDDCFKLYYFFSHPDDHIFLAVEFGLQPGRETYPSIFPIYPAVEPFEREIADLFGLLPEQREPRVLPQAYLHSGYPAGLYPLRRDWSQAAFQRFMQGSSPVMTLPPVLEGLRRPPAGELYLPIGPIYGGVNEPVNFTFQTSGEVIEEVDLLLGYTHRGVERLYQGRFDLLTGWRLAERVTGDSSIAHSIAYSKAVEVMSGARLSAEAHLLRALMLELERMTNHIGSCSVLAHHLALEGYSAQMAVLREQMMQLNGSLTGSRFLRGANRPGGVILPQPLETRWLRDTVREISDRFLGITYRLAERSDFRERTIGIGVLHRETALQLGTTGLVARASGVQRDFRRQHPFGPYTAAQIQECLGETPPGFRLITRDMSGDMFSRFLQRVLETYVSRRLIEVFLERWKGGTQVEFCTPVYPARVPNFEWGLGYAEGWRGEVVYWIMKDKFERIYRCKVRDPSTLNWPGVLAAVASERRDAETALVDFPAILTSFNLSCAGNDL